MFKPCILHSNIPIEDKMFGWFKDLLQRFGFFNKNADILLLGLDNSGKTTLLHMLKSGSFVTKEPTDFPRFDSVKVGNITFNTHDLGGHERGRDVWHQYYDKVDAVVFLIDSADEERFEEAKAVVEDLLRNPALSTKPFLFLANKSDLKTAVPEEPLRKALGLEMGTGKDQNKLNITDFRAGSRPLEVFICSIQERKGFGEGFEWLSYYLG